MTTLTSRETELVALGAAMGSNCVPCIEYHIQEAHKVGLSETSIRAAIERADEIRRVPARKVLEVAYSILDQYSGDRMEVPPPDPCDEAGNTGNRCCG